MSDRVLYDYEGERERYQRQRIEEIKNNLIPLFNDDGTFSGEFYDKRKGTPEGQPSAPKLIAHLDYLNRNKPGYKPIIGQSLPGFAQKEVESQSRSESLGETFANIGRMAAEKSIEGIAAQAFGKDINELMGTGALPEDFQPEWYESLSAEVLSFFSPAGIATLGFGGFMGKVLVSKALQKAFVKKLVSKEISEVAAKKVAKKVFAKGSAYIPKKGAESAAADAIAKEFSTIAGRIKLKVPASAGALGMYDAARRPFDEHIVRGETDLGDAVLDIMSGFAHGAGVGTAFGVAGGVIPGAGLLSNLGRFGAEVGVMGSTAPLVEGRAPNFEDYKSAAQFLAAMKLVHKAISPFTPKDRPSKREIEKEAKEIQERVEGGEDLNAVIFEGIAKHAEMAEVENPRYASGIVGGKPSIQKAQAEVKATVAKKATPKQMAMTRSSYEARQDIYKKGEGEGVTFFKRKPESKKGKVTYTLARAENVKQVEDLINRVHKLGTDLYYGNKFEKTKLFKELQKAGLVGERFGKEKRFRAIFPEIKEDIAFQAELTRLKGIAKPDPKKPFEFGGLMALGRARDKTVEEAAPKTITEHRTVKQWFSDVLAFTFRAKNRVKTKEGQQEIDNANRTSARIAQLHQLGLIEMKKAGAIGTKMTKEQGIEVSRRIEAGELPAVKRIFDAIRRVYINGVRVDLKRRGITGVSDAEIFPKIKHYLPHELKREVVEKMRSSLHSFKKLFDGDIKTASDETIRNILKSKELRRRGYRISKDIEGFEGIPVLESLAENLLRTKQAKSLADALVKLDREFYHEGLFQDVKYLKPRTLKLPSEAFYERDSRILIPRYLEVMTRRIAEIERWGVDGHLLTKALNKIEKQDYQEYKLMHKMMTMWSGVYNINNPLNPSLKSAFDMFTAWEVATKIGLGRATLLNTTQWVISFLPQMGVWNTLRGGVDLFSPEKRKHLRESGVGDQNDRNAIMAVAGSELPGGWTGKFAELTTKWSGFQAINKLNLYWAAATFDRAIKQWVPQARKGGRLGKLRQAQLKEMHIDYKKDLSKQELHERMFRFAMDSQLQKNIFEEPIMFNEQKLRPLFLFKRFGYRQAMWIKDILWKEGKRGNLAPAIRLVLAGWGAGGAMMWGLNKMKETMSGEPQWRRDDSEAEKVLANLSIIGAFGVISDMVEMEKMSDLARRVKFSVFPVFVSDVLRVFDTYTAVMRDYENYGDGWLATKKNSDRFFTFLGSYPKYTSERLKIRGSKEAKVRWQKGREKKEIYDLILNGNGDAASNRIKLWNKNRTDSPMTIGDFTLGALNKYVRRQMEKRVQLEAKKGTPEYRKMIREQRPELLEKLKQLREKYNIKVGDLR